MRGEHVNIEVANLMPGPSSYFHVRVFSLRFHTSMMNMLLTYLMSYFHVRDSRSVFCICWPGSPVSLFPQELDVNDFHVNRQVFPS